MSEIEIPDAATYAALVAAELRSMADALEVRRAEMREEDDRTIRVAALGEGIRRLRERADELDPAGGQR